MPSSPPPPSPCQWLLRIASALGPRSARRRAFPFLGAIRARGRRAVTSWIRAAGLSGEYRPCYTAAAAAGGKTDLIAAHLAREAVEPLVNGATRLTLAIDGTPTERYGRHVQGAGVHRNPTPGPAGGPLVYGHAWVVLGLLAAHPAWGVVAPRFWRGRTSGRRTCPPSPRNTARPSGRSWSRAAGGWGGRSAGSGCSASRSGW